MKRGCSKMKRGLVVGISILVIGVSVLSSVSSKEVTIYNKTIDEHNYSEDWNLGFILGRVTYFEIGIWLESGVFGEKIECIDLDTGEVVSQEKTGIFGFFLFKFLPIGHNYKIISYFEYSQLSKKVENLGFFQIVKFTHVIK
jgi:hypothetical protein